MAALRRILGDLIETREFARAAELLFKAATSAPTEGRMMYAGLRSLPMPEEPVARLWHAATFTDAGRATRDRIESLTDLLAEAPYCGLEHAQLDELMKFLEPIAARLNATGSR